MDIGNVTWRKASYSGDNGGGCVEVGAWRRASYSGGNGGDCVEVASTGQAPCRRPRLEEPERPQIGLYAVRLAVVYPARAEYSNRR